PRPKSQSLVPSRWRECPVRMCRSRARKLRRAWKAAGKDVFGVSSYEPPVKMGSRNPKESRQVRDGLYLADETKRMKKNIYQTNFHRAARLRARRRRQAHML